MDLDELRKGAPPEQPTVSASMATALLAYSGIAVKMLVDQRLDAHLHTMFMVEYQETGQALPHDHPFEESYYMLEGEVDVVADERALHASSRRRLLDGSRLHPRLLQHARQPHSLARDVAPGPPDRHSYRFNRDWEYLESRLEAGVETTAT